MLHLLNGDATAAVFPDTLPGERAVWRDILMEGPAGVDVQTRAAWLAPRLGVTADEYARRWGEGEAMLTRAGEHDEVVLWFEQDLFCATNLWFILDRLDASHVSLVFPPLEPDVFGLAALEPKRLAPLFDRRQRLGLDDIAEARALWRAYAAPDPSAFTRLEPGLTFARAAIRLHCGRFPSLAHGLDDVEHATLAMLERALDFATLFRTVTRSQTLTALGVGDVQFAMMLRDLATGPTPLVAIVNGEQPFGHWRIGRTPAGADVVAGHADRLALAPLDRWLGGVHLRPGAPLWRWDAAARARAGPAGGDRCKRRGGAILKGAPEKIGRSPAVATRREESPGSAGQGAG